MNKSKKLTYVEYLEALEKNRNEYLKTHKNNCPVCKGTKWDEIHTCLNCHGTGKA